MNNINAVITIACRDITKLLRDKPRIFASLIFPIIFIGVLGTSLQANLSDELGYNFLTFVFIGVIGQTLFQSTAAGLISLIEDRQNDFSQEIFISPVSRYAIIFGKIFGEVLVSFVQVVGVLAFGLIMGIPLSIPSLVSLLPGAVLVALYGGAFGVFVMSFLSDQRAASQIFPFVLFPQFFLAGVFNPIKMLPLPILIASRLSPMTYAVDFLRSVYYTGSPEFNLVTLFSPYTNFLVITVLFLIMFVFGTLRFVKKESNR